MPGSQGPKRGGRVEKYRPTDAPASRSIRIGSELKSKPVAL